MRTPGRKKIKPKKTRKKSAVSGPKIQKKPAASVSGRKKSSSGKKTAARGRAKKALSGSEKILLSLLENSPDIILRVDRDSKIKFLNRAVPGFVKEKVIGSSVYDYIDPEFHDNVRNSLKRAWQTGKADYYELAGKGPNGGTSWYETRVVPLKNSKKVTDLMLISTDITGRKHTEEILLKEKNFSETAINSLPGAFYLFDDKGKMLRWNKNLEKITGYSGKEISKMSPLDFFRDGDKELASEGIREVFAKGKNSIEANLALKNGEKIPFYFTGLHMITADKSYVVGMGIDISERRRMEEMIIRSQQEWERIFNSITNMVTVHDKDFNIIRANKAAKKILGLPLLNGANAKCFQYYHGKDSPPENCPSCLCLKTKKSAVAEVFEPHLDRFVEIRAMPRLDGDDNLIGMIHIVRDITKRRKIEEEHGKLLDAVTKAKIEWEMAFDSAMELIIILDERLNVVRCNRSFADSVGKPVNEIAGNKLFDYFHPHNPQQTEKCRKLILKKEPITGEEIKTDTGRWLYVSSRPVKDTKGEFLHTVIIATDIKELKNVQQRLKQSEKELKKRLNELEKFYNMAIGREMKMKELKMKIKELQFQLSEDMDGVK